MFNDTVNCGVVYNDFNMRTVWPGETQKLVAEKTSKEFINMPVVVS